MSVGGIEAVLNTLEKQAGSALVRKQGCSVFSANDEHKVLRLGRAGEIGAIVHSMKQRSDSKD